MVSGYFPLSRHGDLGKFLIEALEKIRNVSHNEELNDSIYSGDVGVDLGVSDGGYLTRLQIAADLIEDCLEKQ